MPVLSLACHLPHNTPNIPSRYNNEQTTKQTKAINNSYIYIYISCKCDTNRAGHFTFDAYASRPVAWVFLLHRRCSNYIILYWTPVLMDWAKTTARREGNIQVSEFNETYTRGLTVSYAIIELFRDDTMTWKLTYWGRDEIDAISQTTFSNAFSGVKMNEFCLGFHWSLFLRFELTIFYHWFR